MNLFLAIFLLMVVNFFGLRIGVTDGSDTSKVKDLQVQIIQVNAKSPADMSGLKLLDTIVGFKSGDKLIYASSVGEVQSYIVDNAGNRVTMLIKRGDLVIEKIVEPRKNPPAGEGALGISLALTGIVKYPWYEAVWRGVYDARQESFAP